MNMANITAFETEKYGFLTEQYRAGYRNRKLLFSWYEHL